MVKSLSILFGVTSMTAVVVEEEIIASHYVLSVIDSLKKRIAADRLTYIKVI